MSTDYTNENVLSSTFMKELHVAFSHVESVNAAFLRNDAFFFMGCDVALLTEGSITFEEYYCRNILKKVENVSVAGVDPTLVAENEFKDFLKQQDDVNTRVSFIIANTEGTALGRVLDRAYEIINHRIFFDFHPLCIRPRYTSGATTDLTRLQGANPINRCRSSSGAGALRTRLNAFYQEYGLDHFPLTAFLPFHGSCSNFFVEAAFVAKTWKTDRTIGLQQVIPLAYQTGLGDYMAGRLNRVGINIETAQRTHVQLARENSLTDGLLMTLDQSNASNNILVCLVKRLTSELLFGFMDAITPRHISFDEGKTLQSMHMLANQGNGYIFPLQTAIFYALTKSVCETYGYKGTVTCYGDDLIAPKRCYDKLLKVFNALGLQVNEEKTFHSGNFRESCGGDFFSGSNVRPHYVSQVPTTVNSTKYLKHFGTIAMEVSKNVTTTVQWIRCINGIRRVGLDNNLGHWRTNAFRRFWYGCISHIPRSHRLFAPIHYGDGAIGTSDERLYVLRHKTHYTTSNGVRCAYPNKGIHSSGHPYSGWYIDIYVNGPTSRGVNFDDSSKGIKSYLLARLVSLAHLKGMGSVKRVINIKGVKTPITVYPSLLEQDDYAFSKRSTPFFLGHPAPSDDIGALFTHLGEDNVLYDSAEVIQRGAIRYEQTISKLRQLLVALYNHKKGVLSKVSNTDFDLV